MMNFAHGRIIIIASVVDDGSEIATHGEKGQKVFMVGYTESGILNPRVTLANSINKPKQTQLFLQIPNTNL